MQINAQLPAATSVDAVGRDRVPSRGRASATGPVRAADSAVRQAQWRDYSRTLPGGAGLSVWQPQFNAEASRTQMAAGFLARGISRLGALESALSHQIPTGTADSALQRRTAEFAELWRSRNAQTGGSVGPALEFDAAVPARRAFSIRGVDIRSMQAGDSEILTFSFADSRVASVALEPDLADAEIVRRFDHALAPAGVRAAADGQGGLTFSVAESAWPAVRDALAMRGGGIRWPTGQFSRVQSVAVPDAIEPARWSVDSAEDMRSTLQQAVRARDAFSQAKRRVDSALADISRSIDAARPRNDAGRAASFAQSFRALGEAPDYRTLTQFSAALAGIRRERVQTLLKFPNMDNATQQQR
jgi:hypothetical protein